MTIAVTGATGFLGRYIVAHLAQSGHQVRAWYRPSSDRSGFDMDDRLLAWVPGELGDPSTIDALLEGCDAVIHSALDHPGRGFLSSGTDVIPFVERNIVGTLRLIEAARVRGVGRFVFISTCAVHDVILDDRPLDESHPLWPLSHYGAHKAAIEAFVCSYGRGQGFPICSLRPTGICGLAHPPSRSKWIELVARVARGERVACRGGGKEVHARDVARAAGLLLEASAEAVTGQAFNCYDMYISQYDVATIARDILGSDSPIEGGPTRQKHQIETAKIRALGMTFGGRPLLEETVRSMIEACRPGAGLPTG